LHSDFPLFSLILSLVFTLSPTSFLHSLVNPTLSEIPLTFRLSYWQSDYLYSLLSGLCSSNASVNLNAKNQTPSRKSPDPPDHPFSPSDSLSMRIALTNAFKLIMYCHFIYHVFFMGDSIWHPGVHPSSHAPPYLI